MMKTKRKLSEALKRNMKNEALDLISVKRLTDECKINRQTFYYHFRNIYDLLTWTFLNESVDVSNVESFDRGLTTIYDYVSNNEALIINALNSAAKDLVNEFLFNKFYNVTLQIIKQVRQFSVEEQKFYARLYGAGFASTLLAFLQEDNNDFAKLKEQQNKVMANFISHHHEKR